MEDIKQDEYLNLGEVLGFMASKGHIYENARGVDIQTYGSFFARCGVYDQGPVAFSLVVDTDDDDPALTRKLGLRSMEDLEQLDKEVLWGLYGEGKGYVIASLEYWDGAELRFEVDGLNTVISCEQLGYDDEVVGVWDTVEPFRDYVREHIMELYELAEGVEDDE